MKAIAIVEQYPVIAETVASMNETVQKFKAQLEALGKELDEEKKAHWDIIRDELVKNGLIEKNEDGEYPSLHIKDDQVVFMGEPPIFDIKEALHDLKKLLE